MTAKAAIRSILKDIYLILLPIPVPGFEEFVGAWVHAADPVMLIDVGPAVSAQALLKALAAIGVAQPKYILLTHIHIDHAGGIGAIAEAFPHAQVVCHPKAVPHLVDPQHWWQGSLRTLGPIAQAYGAIAPLDPQQVLGSDQFQSSAVRCVETPGHASHHISFMVDDLLFAGEAGGVCITVPGNKFYLRPATPPRFFLETSLQSIDRLIALSPNRICYGHIGLQPDAMRLLEIHREQLVRWREIIRPFVLSTRLSKEDAQYACRNHLLAKDPLLAGWHQLPQNVQQRETGFLLNSIKGYWDYLGTETTAS